MKRTRITEVFVERDEVYAISPGGRTAPGWCAACGAEVLMLVPEVAAAVYGTSARQLYRLVEASRLHFTEDAAERLLICSRSLAQLQSTTVNQPLVLPDSGTDGPIL